jgi:hypothetical protein
MAMTNRKIKDRFNRLLQMMATQPEPSEKQQGDNQTSDTESGAGYGDTRTREGKKLSASSKRELKSP